jgi:hypothetical protein
MTQSETAKLLTMIAATWDQFKVSDVKVEVWTVALQDLDFGTVQRAFGRYVSCAHFPPVPADIRDEVLAMQRPDSLTAGEAWGRMMGAVREWGYYHESEAMRTMGPDAAGVAQLLGWREINLCNLSEIGVMRGQFLKMYGQIHDRQDKEIRLPASLRSSGVTTSDLELLGDLKLEITDGSHS